LRARSALAAPTVRAGSAHRRGEVEAAADEPGGGGRGLPSALRRPAVPGTTRPRPAGTGLGRTLTVFGRSRKVPADLRPSLERDERVLSWAPAEPTGAVVVTDRGVWLPGHERLGWHQIHKATWANPRLTVIPSTQVGEGQGYAVMADGSPVVVLLSRPDDVPADVRTRVTRPVASPAHYPPPGGGLRVVGPR